MTTATMQVETKQRPWWLTLMAGILALVIGAIMLWGETSTKLDVYTFLIAVLGLYFLIDGIMHIVSMFVDHSMWGWKLFLGIIGIIAGLYVLEYPVVSAIALPKIYVLVLGIWGIMSGVALFIMAFQGGGWGAGILGALGLIFGLALTFNYQDFGMGLAMIWVAAIWGVVGGIWLIVRAFQQRKA
ncbi:MAG TPA: DUF308 domain-containing protein [Anaerolineales bacterium]|nr:DUF308 domain-containing protein [Anaerolineales bacterium]